MHSYHLEINISILVFIIEGELFVQRAHLSVVSFSEAFEGRPIKKKVTKPIPFFLKHIPSKKQLDWDHVERRHFYVLVV